MHRAESHVAPVLRREESPPVLESVTMYRLAALNGDDPDWRALIREERVVLGRDADCRVHVDHPAVAKRHLELCMRNEQVHMRVLDGAEPVMLRGEAQTGAILVHGDVLEFGDLHLQVQLIRPMKTYDGRAPDLTRVLATGGVVLVVAAQVLILFGLWLSGRRGARAFVAAPAEEAVQMEPELPDLGRFGLDPESEKLALQIWQDITEGRYSEAEAQLDELEGLAPNPLITFPARAVILEKQARFDEAIALFDDLIARFHDSPDVALLEEERSRMLAAAAVAAAVEIAEQDASEIDAVLAYAPEAAPAQPAIDPHPAPAIDPVPEPAMDLVPEPATVSVPEPPEAAASPPDELVSADLPAEEPGEAGRIRIASMHREKFVDRESYDEIRLIRIALSPRKSAGPLQPEKLQVDVEFLDRDLATGTIAPSAVPAPEKGLRIRGASTDWENQSLSALYMVPRGFRQREREAGAGEKQFYGYIVRVFYDGVVQDEAAFPSSLID